MLNSGKTKSMFINLEYEQLKNEKGDAILQAKQRRVNKIFYTLGHGVTNTVTSAQERLWPGDL